MAFVQKDL